MKEQNRRISRRFCVAYGENVPPCRCGFAKSRLGSQPFCSLIHHLRWSPFPQGKDWVLPHRCEFAGGWLVSQPFPAGTGNPSPTTVRGNYFCARRGWRPDTAHKDTNLWFDGAGCFGSLPFLRMCLSRYMRGACVEFDAVRVFRDIIQNPNVPIDDPNFLGCISGFLFCSGSNLDPLDEGMEDF